MGQPPLHRNACDTNGVSQPTAIPQEAEVAGAPPASAVPPPEPITATGAQLAAVLKTHNLTDDEYALILQALGRTPSLTELGIYSVMWSEHCSYKSSKVHLKRLPTKGTRLTGPGSVMQGPGENAGIIDVGDGWACAFKIESHNHPSYIEPYQGAATGVGGILRDIFTMGARPMAVMDSLRFGPLVPEEQGTGNRAQGTASASPELPLSSRSEAEGSAFAGVTEDTSEEADAAGPAVASADIDYAKNRSVMEGVVHGVAGYGNCFGVPNVGGETRFEACYSGNPLLNAFALGLVRHDEIFYAKATGIGNPVIYVGAKTGRDGIHGATMASEEFTEGSEQKRPNVQMGDPFLEKLLLEACLEAMKTGAVAGIQDMGAAGLTCSICEMGARGEVGLDVELNLVPQRDSSMTSYEIMLSESQERMLLVAHAGREQEVLDVFVKWGLDAAVVGTVVPENRMRIRHGGVLVADLSNTSLTDDAPLYHRAIGTWKAPVPLDLPAWVLEELKKPRDYTADLKKLLASSNICSKRHIYEQYDSMVQTNTVFGPGQAEAGVIRIKGTGREGTGNRAQGTADATTAGKPERGLAMALAGNGRWTYLDPKLGAMHAVAEAARKVACTGATPVAATNCLNFGNPMKPEIMAQLTEAIDGIAEACTVLGTPITGGNVSLYNETKGEGIYPTPVIGIVGILDDVSKAVPSGFSREGETIVSLSPGFPLQSEPAEAILLEDSSELSMDASITFGSSEAARMYFGQFWGAPPAMDVTEAASLNVLLADLANASVLTSAQDVSDGGVAVTCARAAMARGIGADVHLDSWLKETSQAAQLFFETPNRVLVTCRPADVAAVQALAEKQDCFADVLGTTGGTELSITVNGTAVVRCAVAELQTAADALEQQLESELVLA